MARFGRGFPIPQRRRLVLPPSFTGSGSPAVTATVAGSGSGGGSGAVTVTAAIAGSGSVPGVFTGTGAVAVSAAVAGAGAGAGSGSVAAVAAIAGAGSVAGSGSGSVAATASITGAGRGTGAGSVAASAAIAGTGAVSGTGSVAASATIAGSGVLFYFNDANDGTNGAAVVAGTGLTADGSTKFISVQSTGTLTYDNAQVVEGALAFKVVTDGTGADRNATWDNTQIPLAAPLYVSKLLYLPSLPGSNLTVGLVSAASFSTQMVVRINSSGKVVLADHGGFVMATTTSSVPTGAWFRLEYALLVSSATVGQAEVRLFTSPGGTTPSETQTSAASFNTVGGSPVQLYTSGSGPANYTYWWDRQAVAFAGYPPPPVGAGSFSGTGSRTATATIAGSGASGYVGTGSITATATIAGAGVAPNASAGAVTASATIAGAGTVGDAASVTVSATIIATGRTSTTGSLAAVASITGTGVLAVNYTPRTATTGAGNNKTVTTTLPTGVVSGDLLLCHLSIAQGGTAFTQPTVTTPSGWLPVPTSGSNPLTSQGTNAGIVGAWYYRWATGTDTAPAWTFNATVLFKYSWTIEAYAGGPGSGAPRGIFGSGATGTPVTTDTTDTATITSATWYAETYSERSTTNTSYTTPAGTTRRAAVFGTGGAAVDMLWVDSGGPVSGSVGNDTTTDDGTGAAWQLHGLIVFPVLTVAAITIAATITGTGSVNTPISQITVTAAISGSGSVVGLNPALFVQQAVRPVWTVQLVDAPHLGSSSAVIGDLSQAAARSLTLSTPEGSTLSWTMPGNHPESLLAGNPGIPGLWEMCCDVVVWRDIGKGPIKLWRGRVAAGADASDDTGSSVVIPWTAVDYKALFASRLLLDGDTLTFAASTDVAAIAWSLINTCQARTNGNMGLTKSTDGWSGGTANTGKTFGASFIVTPGTDLQNALNTLLAGDTTAPAGAAAGFDWWIDPDLQVHIKSRNQVPPNPPGRGTASTFVADYQGTVRSFSRTPLVDQYANLERGDGGTGTTPSTASAPTLTTDPMGRVERAIQVNVDTTQTTAQQNALIAQVTAEALYVGNIPAASYSLVLASGVWDPDILSVGDNMQTVIQTGRLNVTGQQRVLTLQIELSDDGDEKVTVTTQRPDVTHWQADALVKLGNRVRGLELRS